MIRTRKRIRIEQIKTDAKVTVEQIRADAKVKVVGRGLVKSVVKAAALSAIAHAPHIYTFMVHIVMNH